MRRDQRPGGLRLRSKVASRPRRRNASYDRQRRDQWCNYDSLRYAGSWVESPLCRLQRGVYPGLREARPSHFICFSPLASIASLASGARVVDASGEKQDGTCFLLLVEEAKCLDMLIALRREVWAGRFSQHPHSIRDRQKVLQHLPDYLLAG